MMMIVIIWVILRDNVQSDRQARLVALPLPHFDVGSENHTNASIHSPLQFLHLKFKNRSVCLLCIWFDSCLPEFILVDKIVLRNFLKGLSLLSQISQKTKNFKFIKTLVLQQPEYAACSEALRSQIRSKQRSRGDLIDFMLSLRVFVTIWLLFFIARPDEEPHWRDVVSLPHAEESFREWLRLILLRFAALKKFYTNQIDIIFNALIPAEVKRFNPCKDAHCPEGIPHLFRLPAVPFRISECRISRWFEKARKSLAEPMSLWATCGKGSDFCSS